MATQQPATLSSNNRLSAIIDTSRHLSFIASTSLSHWSTIAWLQTWAGLCIGRARVFHTRFGIYHAPSSWILFTNFVPATAS